MLHNGVLFMRHFVVMSGIRGGGGGKFSVVPLQKGRGVQTKF